MSSDMFQRYWLVLRTYSRKYLKKRSGSQATLQKRLTTKNTNCTRDLTILRDQVIVEAELLLSKEISMVEGCRNILQFHDVFAEYELEVCFNIFRRCADIIGSFPVGESRKLWHKDLLIKKDEKRHQLEKSFGVQVNECCRQIITVLRNPPTFHCPSCLGALDSRLQEHCRKCYIGLVYCSNCKKHSELHWSTRNSPQSQITCMNCGQPIHGTVHVRKSTIYTQSKYAFKFVNRVHVPYPAYFQRAFPLGEIYEDLGHCFNDFVYETDINQEFQYGGVDASSSRAYRVKAVANGENERVRCIAVSHETGLEIFLISAATCAGFEIAKFSLNAFIVAIQSRLNSWWRSLRLRDEPSPKDLINSICVRTPHWELEIDGRFTVHERARILDNIDPFVESPENIHDFAESLKDEVLSRKVIAATRRVSRLMDILISYRRDDSSGYTGRLYDRLVKEFGQHRVFIDIDTIGPGDDFVEVLSNVVDTCEALIAVIGKKWVSRRLERPNDFVRLEILGAMRRGIRVIPVLVGGAKMVNANDLPDDLKNLANYQALELSDRRFHEDVDDLVKALKECLAVRGQL